MLPIKSMACLIEGELSFNYHPSKPCSGMLRKNKLIKIKIENMAKIRCLLRYNNKVHKKWWQRMLK